MNAYIEFVILDNFMITYFIGAASCRFLHLRCKRLRLFLCALTGTAAAVGFPFLPFKPIWLVLLKVALGAALTAILFLKRCNYFTAFAVFMVITFMFGGLLFCVALFRYGNVAEALTQPVSGVPVGVILMGGLILYLIVKRLFVRFNRRKDAAAHVLPVQIEILGQTIQIKGFLDTGNRLYDAKTGLPVIVLSVKALLPVLQDEQLSQIFGGNIQEIFPESYYITFSSLGKSEQKLLLIKPQRFAFYNRDKVNILNDVMIGLSFSKITDAVEYDAILHPALKY